MEFGELKEVELRDVWAHEAHDFTPWLADNLERLSKVIGIPIELVDTEEPIGQFAADIVCQNPEDGNRVLIENQLEGSDHTHLGQILTYLAGSEARIIIWIAHSFAEPHLSAIRSFNENTAEPFSFFAVKVRVLQIADSSLVPQFEVLERPSQWDRSLRDTIKTGLSEMGEFRRDFWTSFTQRHPGDGIAEGYAGSAARIPVDSANLNISAYIAKSGVGLCLRGASGEPREAVLARLQLFEDALQDELGVKIGEGTAWGTYAYSTLSTDSSDRGNWPAMTDWLHDKIRDYRRTLEFNSIHYHRGASAPSR